MAISLKDYTKTEYTGLYVSIESDELGYKYICRFQVDGKKYLKVLGYSKKDGLNHELANEEFLSYKEQIKKSLKKSTNTTSSPKPSSKTSLDKKISKEKLDSLMNISRSYYKLLGSVEKVELALKRRYQKNTLIPYQVELIKLQEYLDSRRKKILILFEGRDASGKGGAIRIMSRFMNSKHYRVVALGKPSDKEKGQWFFQRYVENFPRAGETVLFDRSWYNRAMVEPVFEFCTQKEYENFFLDVRQFEKSIIRNDIILIKLYFSVSKEIQATRFQGRSKDPLRQWKLSEVDLQAQNLWDVFTEKKYKMLKDSEISEAPWQIIRSDDKYLTRLESIKAVLRNIDYPNKNLDLDYKEDKSVSRTAKEELEYMDTENKKLSRDIKGASKKK